MTTVRWIMAATLLGAVALTSPLRAEDLSVPILGNNSQALNPNDVRQSDTAEAAQSRGDDASKVTDLESTRAALDRRAGPALSLASAAGWASKLSMPTEN